MELTRDLAKRPCRNYVSESVATFYALYVYLHAFNCIRIDAITVTAASVCKRLGMILCGANAKRKNKKTNTKTKTENEKKPQTQKNERNERTNGKQL